MRSLRLLLVVGVTLLNSCTDASVTMPDGGESDAEFDQQVMDTASSYKHWHQINKQTDPSAIGDYNINVYVHGDVSGYESIHPTVLTSASPLTQGTIIVREVLDSSGNVSQLTLMAKGQPGYDPTLGDWWFGVADPSGQPVVSQGVAQEGRLLVCHTCHIPRESDDYLFGVPLADEQP